MRRDILREKFLKSLMQNVNPLGFVKPSGESEIFKSVEESYLVLLIRMKTLSPICYLELPLLLKHLYPHFSFNECRIYAEELEKLGCQQVFFAQWDSQETKEYCERLLRGLCALSKTNYSNDYFQNAWNRFQNMEEFMGL